MCGERDVMTGKGLDEDEAAYSMCSIRMVVSTYQTKLAPLFFSSL